MLLPYKFKLGHQRYNVKPFLSSGNKTGATYPETGQINIATHTRKGPRPPAAVQLSFWHEATHAILYDMDSDLWNDEGFVTEFSSRLVKLINTAEFK